MEVFAAVIGAGIVVASPFLPVLRPIAKTAVKGGLAVSEAVVGTAVVVGHQVGEVVSKNKSGSAAESADATANETANKAAQTVAAEPEAADATSKKVGLGTLTAAVAKAGVAMSDKAKEAAKGAGKQWSDLVSEARASQEDAGESDADVEIVVERESADASPVVEAPAKKPAAKKPAAKTATAKKSTAAKTVVEPDDLTQIRGVGPKTATLLADAGIKTYGQLAAADPAQLRTILDQAGSRYRSLNPDGWPEQARQLVDAA